MGRYKDEKFFDIRSVLSYNKLFNIVIGERGVGKTFSCKDFIFNKAIREIDKGRKFSSIYLRRYKTELKTTDLQKMLDDLIKEGYLEPNKIELKGKSFMYKGQVIMECIALSQGMTKKSVDYSNVKYILFEEFLIKEGNYRYLPDEVETFLDFYETVSRDREVVCILTGNNISDVNPYFLYWNIHKPEEGQVLVDSEILVTLLNNQSYREYRDSTRWGRFLRDKCTRYAEHSIDNQSLKGNNEFIEKKSGKLFNAFVLVYKDKEYGVWFNYKEGKVFVSNDYLPNNPNFFTMTLEDHKPNMFYIKALKNFRHYQQFITAVKNGQVYYEDILIKEEMYKLYSMILR